MLGALFGFNGRLSRAGFWEVLASVSLIDAAFLIGRMYVADSGLPGGNGPQSPLSLGVIGWSPWAIAVFTLWALLAAMVKRCHDRGRTGALVLVGLIPVIGWLWLLVDLFVLPGARGGSRPGGAPRRAESAQPSRFSWAEPAAAAEPVGHDPWPPYDQGPAPIQPQPAAEVPREPAPPAAVHEPEADVHRLHEPEAKVGDVAEVAAHAEVIRPEAESPSYGRVTTIELFGHDHAEPEAQAETASETAPEPERPRELVFEPAQAPPLAPAHAAGWDPMEAPLVLPPRR